MVRDTTSSSEPFTLRGPFVYFYIMEAGAIMMKWGEGGDLTLLTDRVQYSQVCPSYCLSRLRIPGLPYQGPEFNIK